MSVIAWDGKTLAADKRALSYGYPSTVTKIFRTDLGLIGIEGDFAAGLEVVEWIKGGADPKAIPELWTVEGRKASATRITPEGRILRYEQGPYPFEIQDTLFAAGSGRELALAAMHFGKTAGEAVEFAARFDVNCGNGVDELELRPMPAGPRVNLVDVSSEPGLCRLSVIRRRGGPRHRTRHTIEPSATISTDFLRVLLRRVGETQRSREPREQ